MNNKFKEKIYKYLEKYSDLKCIVDCLKKISFYRNLNAFFWEKQILRKHPDYIYLMKQNEDFKDKYIGKRCFILGNGPSLNKVDFSLLENEFTFTVNQLPKNPNFPKLKTNFHVWTDSRFFKIDENKPEDMELLETMKKVNSYANKPIIFYSESAMGLIKKYSLDKDLNIRYLFIDCIRNISDYNKKALDFSDWIPDFPTVVMHTVCLAIYMGFKEIYLLGIDCSSIMNVIQGKLHQGDKALYSYKITDNEKKRLEKQSNMTSMKYELGAHLDLFNSYEQLLNYCNNQNIKIYNCSNPTLLECLPKIELNEVL